MSVSSLGAWQIVGILARIAACSCVGMFYCCCLHWIQTINNKKNNHKKFKNKSLTIINCPEDMKPPGAVLTHMQSWMSVYWSWSHRKMFCQGFVIFCSFCILKQSGKSPFGLLHSDTSDASFRMFIQNMWEWVARTQIRHVMIIVRTNWTWMKYKLIQNKTCSWPCPLVPSPLYKKWMYS